MIRRDARIVTVSDLLAQEVESLCNNDESRGFVERAKVFSDKEVKFKYLILATRIIISQHHRNGESLLALGAKKLLAKLEMMI